MRSIVGLDPIDAGAIALRRNGTLWSLSRRMRRISRLAS